MKMLVTGGTGYIGSHTVVALQEAGFQSLILDNLSNSNVKVLDRIESITGVRPLFECVDVCNKDSLKNILDQHDDLLGCIHFAAYKAVGESVEQPLKYYRNNLMGMINLLEELPAHGINSFIFSSSATVYGQPEVLPATEESPILIATSPYGNTKQINEEMLGDFIQASKGFNGIALRYFNPIGAHESGLIGEFPLGVPNNLMPFITQTAIGKREMLKVFGDNYNTPDGTAVRDYIHVVDLAEAHVVAIQRLLENKNNTDYEVFNVGTGKGFSVLEVIKSFEKMSGTKLNYQIVGRRDGDVEKIFASTDLANKELGWKSKLNLDDMTSSSWKWEQHLFNENK